MNCRGVESDDTFTCLMGFHEESFNTLYLAVLSNTTTSEGLLDLAAFATPRVSFPQHACTILRCFEESAGLQLAMVGLQKHAA